MKTLLLSLLFPLAVFAQTAPTTGEFNKGFPTETYANQTRDNEDFQNAVTAYRFWYPTVSYAGAFHGMSEIGAKENQNLLIAKAAPQGKIFTPNADTPYGM